MISIFQDTLFAQRLLKSCGLYQGVLDGNYGGMTKAAEDAFEATYKEIKQQLGEFDLRTEGVIATLLPKAQILARKFMQIASKQPFQVKLIGGTRTYKEQDTLYNQRPVVTKAKGGYSNHNFAIAWDAGIFVNGEYYDGSDKDPKKATLEEKAYKDLSKAVLILPTLDWGGNWRTIIDNPHYEVHSGKTVSQCRALLEAGKPYI